MADQYAKSKGVLFINENTGNSKAPTLKGHVLLTKDQISALIFQLKNGEDPKLQIAGWNQTSQAGKDYISLQTDIKAKLSDEGEANPVLEGSHEDPAESANPFT